MANMRLIESREKTQAIRLADVFIIGPVMIAGALALPAAYPLLRLSLGAFGVATIVYNARNYALNA